MMRIAVTGAGAVGCYYGGLLARAGNEVVLIGRPQHVLAIEQRGLRLETAAFDDYIHVPASSQIEAVRGANIVLCCVKSSDSEQTAKDMAPFLDPQAIILSLQNGVDNADRLQRHIKQRVFPVVVYVATEMAGSGHVKHHGRGELVTSPDCLTATQQQVFTEAGIPLQISEQVRAVLWLKLLVNCAYNALSAITQLPYGRLVEGEGVLDVMEDIVGECRAVAEAEGISLPEDPWEAVLRIARSMPGQRSSTAQDLALGKRTEIDHLNGYIVRKGKQWGIKTPVNQMLHAQVKLLESRSTG
jgi:2-dehydropantoate 2-reductase